MSAKIDPASSKGARIEDPPDPQSRLAKLQKLCEVCPAPPRPEEQDEGTLEVWLHKVGEAGGLEMLQLAWQPSIFPGGPYWRGRLQHVYGTIFRKLEDEAKQKVEAEANARAANDRDALRSLLKEKGWAR